MSNNLVHKLISNFAPKKKMGINTTLVFLGLFVFALTVYFISSAGNTPYDYFIRLSKAFLEGRYWLSDNPPWLSELIPWEKGKYYFVNPLMPALLSTPFVWLFGEGFQQQYLAHLLGALAVGFTAILSWRIKNNFHLAIWSALLVGFGSIFWFLSSTGSAWYLGQVSAFFFLITALAEVYGKKRVLLIAILLSAAFLSRTQVVLTLPLFIFILKDKLMKPGGLIRFLPGIGIFFIIFFTYNYLRFGNILDTGYVHIPGILNEPWFDKGIFHYSYIPNHLRILLAALPVFTSQFPFVYPTWSGLAIWLTTPAFIYSLTASIKDRENIVVWLSVAAIFLINFSFGSTGVSQFGYRYAVDFYPFLTLLTIKGVSKTGLKWHHWLLLGIGILVNLWGVLWINKFGWIA